MRISVVVPTFRRAEYLTRCLLAIAAQRRPADEVVVVVRDGDAESLAALRPFNEALNSLRVAVSRHPGQVAALNAGLDAATGDIVCITDDDAEPRPDWLARIERHMNADEKVAGVGGRDWQPVERWDEPIVGKMQWFGRYIGNHHLGAGPPRCVDILKGVNMSFRRTAIGNIRFDERLLGEGAQMENDLAFSLAIRRAGWKLIYDPEVGVDHNVAPRLDIDQRNALVPAAHRNMIHNETLAVLEHLSAIRRIAFAAWAILLGTRKAPGLGQLPRLLARGHAPGELWRRFTATWAGRRAGLATFLRHRGRDAT